MTQAEFGTLFGVTRDNIASYERGSEPKVEFIYHLLNLFNVSFPKFIEKLLNDSDIPPDIQRRYPHFDLSVGEPLPEYDPGSVAPQTPAPEISGWKNIPVYELDARGSLSDLFEDPHSFEAVDYFAASSLPRCDAGLLLRGEGMAADLKSGDIVFYKRVRDIENGIIWGEIYLLSFEMEGDEYITVKFLYPSERPGYLTLTNSETSAISQELPLSRIKGLALVKSSNRNHTLL